MKLHEALALIDKDTKYMKTRTGSLKIYVRQGYLVSSVEPTRPVGSIFVPRTWDFFMNDWEVGEDQ